MDPFKLQATTAVEDNLCEDIERILENFRKEDAEIREKLKEIRTRPPEEIEDEQSSQNTATAKVEFDQELKEATIRNKKLIKDLELATARLRTRASYSPTEHALERAKIKYIHYLNNRSCAMDKQ